MSEIEVEKKKTSNKDIVEFIGQIVELTEQLKVIVSGMPKCTARDAYEYAVTNLEKKNDRFTKTREKLSEEEKQIMREALKKFREQNNPSETEISQVSTDNDSESSAESVSGKKKGKGKHV